MQTTTIAVDIAKSVFEIAVSTQAGRVKERALEHTLQLSL